MMKVISMLILAFLFISCGKAYFPLELKTISRTDRLKGQENQDIELISMTKKSINQANKTKYVRRIIDASDLSSPAKILPFDGAIPERLPVSSDPGPYTLGRGDVLTFARILENQSDQSIQYVPRTLKVSEEGFLNVYEIGRIKVVDLTQSELENLIHQKLLENGEDGKFELSLLEFNSKRIFLAGEDIKPTKIPYTNIPLFLSDIISTSSVSQSAITLSPVSNALDKKITVLREGAEYVVSLSKVLNMEDSFFRMFPNDSVTINSINYRKERVLVVGETGAQTAIPISVYDRPTLSDTIFGGSVLNRVTSDFSQIYILRETNNKFLAYHLDITNPSRINLANSFEMRPDDIVFVAAQPLTLYSRALQQILGSTGATISARNQVRQELGN